MNADHAHFVEWDAAYVLGALSQTDRRAFEAHLDSCADCRRAVGELGPTVGLLSRLPADLAVTVQDAPDPALKEGIAVLARERSARRRRRVRIWTAAAALLVVAAVAVPLTVSSLSRSEPAFALEDVSGAPLEASVRLTRVAWGTEIDIECRYTEALPADAPADGRPYALAVVGDDGSVTTVSTWRALPGSTAQLTAGTALDADAIRSVEIRTVTDGRVLMRYSLPATPAG